MGQRSELIASLEVTAGKYEELVRRLKIVAASTDSRAADAAHIILSGVVDG